MKTKLLFRTTNQTERNNTPEQHSDGILEQLKAYWEELKNLRKPLPTKVFTLYPGRESNPHGRNDHRILSPACLPVPPPGRSSVTYSSSLSVSTNTQTGTVTYTNLTPFTFFTQNFFEESTKQKNSLN